MKVIALVFLFLSLAATMHSVQALFGAEGSLCSEAIKGVTQCVAANCPEQTKAGTCATSIEDADSCADVEAMCQEYSNCCSDQCATELEQLGACVPDVNGGALCTVDCMGGGAVATTEGTESSSGAYMSLAPLLGLAGGALAF
jgi:hypothetical protein